MECCISNYCRSNTGTLAFYEEYFKEKLTMTSLLLAIAFATLLTLISKICPIVILSGDNIPSLVKRWLNFVPVAVMAALVGPDIFFYQGKFNIGLNNLFLLVSIPVIFVAWKTSNYFITIAVGILLVIICRQLGLS